MKGLYSAKLWYSKKLNFFLKLAVKHKLSPDLFTWIGVLASILAMLAIISPYWFLTGLFIAARLAGANLDGAVARARKLRNPYGFVLNEIGDRLSDSILILGLVFSALTLDKVTISLLLFALFAATFPTFISLSGKGAGAERINGGPFGKTERCLVIFLCDLFIAWGSEPVNTFRVTAIIIIIGSFLTFLYRNKLLRKVLSQGDTIE